MFYTFDYKSNEYFPLFKENVLRGVPRNIREMIREVKGCKEE